MVGRYRDYFMVYPLWCNSWKCERCAARMTSLWANRIAEAKPQRMMTFTWIGDTRGAITLSLQQVMRDLRGQGFEVEYWGVVELHKKGDPHMHLLQKGSYIPSKALKHHTANHGWGFTDIRACTSGWSATWYCAKHLCHSHGRRWDGRLIRYSKHFFEKTRKQEKKERAGDGWEFEVIFGRASVVAEKLHERGLDVKCGDLGLDWIMGEGTPGGFDEKLYSRDVTKGYVEQRNFFALGTGRQVLIEDYVRDMYKRIEREGS